VSSKPNPKHDSSACEHRAFSARLTAVTAELRDRGWIVWPHRRAHRLEVLSPDGGHLKVSLPRPSERPTRLEWAVLEALEAVVKPESREV